MRTAAQNQHPIRGADSAPGIGRQVALGVPPVLIGLIIIAAEIADRAGVGFPFGLSFPRAESARDSADAWLCLVTLSGAGVVLSWYGWLIVGTQPRRDKAGGHRAAAPLLAIGTVVGMSLWAFSAGERFGRSETVVAWTIGAHLPALAFCYGLLGQGLARLPDRRLAVAVLAGMPLLLTTAQLLYVPGGDDRAAALGFIVNSALIAVAIAVRLAIWLRHEEPASQLPVP